MKPIFLSRQDEPNSLSARDILDQTVPTSRNLSGTGYSVSLQLPALCGNIAPGLHQYCKYEVMGGSIM